ncbi:MAG: hypothetical protein ABSF90_10535 [Syntrophobacteraceae bacterium]|jgi:hypothetical protein
MPKLDLNAEANVTNYNVMVDGGTPVPVIPEADGSAVYDLSGCAPGAHTVTAQACNASGCSAFMPDLTFSIPEPVPVPAVPTGEIDNPAIASQVFRGEGYSSQTRRG